MFLLFSFFACQPDPAASLAPWPRDISKLELRCQDETNQSIQITCWIQLAARLGEEQEEVKGQEVCRQIQSPLWEEECYFRLGEELSVGGSLDAGFRACALAGRFTRNCLTHSIWRNPYSQELHSDISLNQLIRNFDEDQAALLSAIQTIDPNYQKEAQMNLLARMGYSIYLGSGIINPEPSYYKDKLGVSFRTGYAFEWVRLQSENKKPSIENLVQDWKDKKVFRKEADPFAFQKGRHYQAILSPFERDIPRIHLYGGGQRLVGKMLEDDIQIAGLEAFFAKESTQASFFEPYLFHQSREIRLTATKLFLLADGWTSLSPSAKEEYQNRFDPAQTWLFENIKSLPPTPSE